MKTIIQKHKREFVALLITAIAISIGLIAQLTYNKALQEFYPQGFSEYVSASAAEFNVPEKVIYATIKTESGFNPDAVSYAGAVGLMQLMPSTFEWLTTSMLKENLPASAISDPLTNIRYGTYMLSWLYGIYGDWETVFEAYNAGVGTVNSWLEDSRYSFAGKLTHIPFSETRTYVKRQIDNIKKYEKLYYTGEESWKTSN